MDMLKMDASLDPDLTRAFTSIKHQVCIIMFKEYFQTHVESSKYNLSFEVLFLTIETPNIGWSNKCMPHDYMGRCWVSKRNLRQEIWNLGVLVGPLNILLKMILKALLNQQLVILCGTPTQAHLLFLVL